MKVCPACNQESGVPILYGLPDETMRRLVDEGLAHLGGCAPGEEHSLWHCQACGSNWRDAHPQERIEAIHAAMTVVVQKYAGMSYTNAETRALSAAGWPQRGPYCEKCEKHIPKFADLTPAQEQELREIAEKDGIKAMATLRTLTGCSAAWAKIWVLHPDGPQQKTHRHRPPCPYCGRPLSRTRAKECFRCGMDWHDPHNPVCKRQQ